VSSDLRQDIFDSVEDINDLLTSYEELFRKVQQDEPNLVELAALGSILQSFYNGVEGIFILIAKQIDKKMPGDNTWHQTLLNQVLESNNNRGSVITYDTASDLAAYMKFRHFFRHAYTFMLDWKRLEPLVDELEIIWAAVRDDVMLFCDSLLDD
jgi:hypothetical protein